MEVLKYIDKNEYESFVLKHNSLFQSIEWGEFAKAYYKVTPHYLGFIDNNELIATVLLLQKDIDENNSIFFIPSDIVYEDHNKTKNIYSKIIKFVKVKKGILIQQLSNNNLLKNKSNKPIIDLKIPNSYKVINTYNIKRTKDYLKEKINKEYLAIEVYKGSKKDLVNLSLDNPINYYETLYEVLNTNNCKTSIYIEKLHITTTINNIEKKIKEINSQISILPIDNLSESAKKKYKLLENKKTDINNILNKYKTLKQKYKNDTIMYTNLLIEFGNNAWILFDKNMDILEDDIEGYSLYLEELNYLEKNNIEIINSPIRINDIDSITTLDCYESKTNYLLYLWLSNKLK